MKEAITTTHDRPVPHTANPPALGLPNDSSRDAAPAAGERRGRETSRARVLVVDDAPDVAEMMAMLMRHAGYDVTTAHNATLALELAGRDRFDLVVSDIGMPDVDGYQLAEELRALPGYESVPLIAVSGFSMYDDRERALASGFNEFLTKPIHPDELLELTDRLRR